MNNTGFKLAQDVLAELGRQMPFLFRSITEDKRSPLEHRLDVLQEIAIKLERIHGNESDWIKGAVKSFVVLSLEFLKLQRLLEQTGRYLLNSERDAQAIVYQNKEIFGKYYLPGLLLSEALWTNHAFLNSFFRNEFLPLISGAANVLEIGVGTGFHLNELIKVYPEKEYLGIDISDIAIDFCKRFVFESNDPPRNVIFNLADAAKGLSVPASTFDAGMLGEVLEHVERPDLLLEEFERVTKKGSFLFMTTVVFAANIDHVYLFEKASDIRDLIRETNWSIEAELVLPVYPNDNAEMEKRPMNYGCVLKNNKLI